MKALDKRTIAPEALLQVQLEAKDRANRALILVCMALGICLLTSLISWRWDVSELTARIKVLENTRGLK